MRIDAHVHGDPAALQSDTKAYVEACRARGIESVALIEELSRCQEAVRKFGDFVIPIARVHIDSAGVREIDECIKGGARGIKFIRPSDPYGDERYWPLYETLEKLGTTAVFHTGYLGFRQREDRPAHMEYMRAAQIDIIARRFPDLKILMAHFSMPWWEEGWKVSWSNKNVYADLSGGTALHRSTLMWSEMFAPDGVVLENSIRKLLFATDVRYLAEGAFYFDPYTAFYDKIFQRINLSDELREVVNRGNARKLFGLEETK